MKHSLLLSILLMPALVGAISIPEVVQNSIKTHPQVQVKKEELKVQEKTLTVIRSDYLPSLDLSYSVGPEVTKTISNQRERADLIRQNASATMSINIFSGLNTKYGVDEQEALILSAGDDVLDTANTLALDAVKAYLDVLKNQELLKIAQENVAVHEKYLAQIKTRLDAGVGRKSDYNQTLSRLENAKSVMFLAQQNYDNSIFSFQRILPGDISAADLEQPTIGSLPAETIEDTVKISMNNNPTIKVSKDNIEAAKAALSRSNSTYYPTADIVAKSYWDKEVNGVSTSASNPVVSKYDEDSGYNALLVLKYNIFNGLADSAKKEVAQRKLLQKNSTLADSKRYIKAYTQIAYQTYKSTEEQLVHIDKNIKASADTVDDYRKEYDLGRRSIIDLLNIELEYNAARNRKVTAKYDNTLAYYQILSYTGKMLEEMNVNVK